MSTIPKTNHLPTFHCWNSCVAYITNQTSCKPFSGEGITIRNEHKTAILKSVDGTFFYDDDLSDPEHVVYTLYGQEGDQDLSAKGNKQLVEPDNIKHIFVYRVIPGKPKNTYMWYGEYTLDKMVSKRHVDKNNTIRLIYRLHLSKK